MPPRSNSPGAPPTSSPIVSLLSSSNSTTSITSIRRTTDQFREDKQEERSPLLRAPLSSSSPSSAPLFLIVPLVGCSGFRRGQWPWKEQYAPANEHQKETGYLHLQNSSSSVVFRQGPYESHRRQLLLPLDGIMSLQQHHHHQHQQQQQQQQSSSSATTATSTTTVTTATTSTQHHHHHYQHHPQLRSSSTSPTHHHHHHHQQQQQQTRYFQQQHRHHHQLQYLPPRPPSTTSSGSLSTCGFPDDLQDDMPLPPPTPQEPPATAGGNTTTTSALYTFHPAHHSILYHRHTSPHYPPQHHLLHHQHYSVPPPPQTHHHSHHHAHHPPHQLSSSASAEHQFGGGGGASGGGSSRAASRATYTGEDEPLEEPEGGGVEEDNLLLVDNSVGVQDAVYLDPVTTDNFLTNVVQRFKRDFIYTYVGEGTLLVSVNPYKPLSIYSPRVKAAYRNISNPFQLPPHIYGQVCLILQRNTSSLERTQTLLLTGESGAGKSTNLSYLLDFLATKQEPHSHAHHHQQPSRSRRNSGRSTSGGGGGATSGSYYLSTGSLHRHHHYSGGGGGSGRASSLSLSAPSAPSACNYSLAHSQYTLPNLALTLLQGNFLLNAFGNCKTGKNWDASRFGKLVQLQIDFLGNVCGGRIVTYQLEKWRVQGPIGGGFDYERNFHIFYILVAGADSTTLKSLRLPRNLETYAMLNVKNHSSFLNASQTSTPSAPFCPHDHYYNSKSGGVKGASHSVSSHYEACFQLVKNTLSSLLPSTSNIQPDHVFRMLAAILKLNNLVFAPVANIDGTEGCDVTNEQELADIGILLQILPGGGQQPYSLSSPSTPNNGNNNISNNNHQNHPLKSILTTRRVSRTDGSIANIELTASESSSLRNALTVSLYTRLFSWLTKQVTVKPPTPGVGTSTTPASTTGSSFKHNLLNIVDFYGFEVFQTNSLEQFLINFTNEKIHFVLADLRLRMLQEEFVRDGLEWIIIDTSSSSSHCSTSPNSAAAAPAGKLIELVEENCQGLLSILANCANDSDLERQFSRRFSSAANSPSIREPSSQDNTKEPSACSSSASSTQKSPPPAGCSSSPSSNTLLVEYLHQSFRLRHWAGPVVYSTRHFASKNRDTLPPHLPHQLYTWTTDSLLRTLFSHDGRTPPSAMDSSAGSSRLLATSNMELSLRNLFQKCGGGGGTATTKSSGHRIYYIRCLKPNELSQPEVTEPALLKHQVRYHRLIDFVRVYREGFTYNLGGFEFLERYKLLSLNTWPNWRHPLEIRLGIQVLMKDLQMKEGLDWCFGGGGGGTHGPLLHHHPSSSGSSNGETLKVYLKGQRILSELEDFRRERLDDLALLIQKVWRGFRDWRRWNRMRNAQTVICRAWRNYLLCKKKEQRKLWKQMRNAVRLIQQRYILWKRGLFLRQLILQIRAELQIMSAQQAQAAGYPPPLTLTTSTTTTTSPGMLSPISKDWPYPPSYLEEASYHLKRVFHRWRCRLYRSRFNEMERAKMAEKVTASLLFKGKKSSYLRSVSHPFLGDYIRLRQNSQWRRTTVMMMLQTVTQSQQLPHVPSTASAAVAAALEEAARSAAAAAAAAAALEEAGGGDPSKKTVPPLLPSQQIQIVFADLINKITRSSGKFLPIVLVVTTTQIMILDPRTLNIKYKIPATEVWRMSVSPYGDDICVLHLQHPRIGPGGGSVLGPGEQGNLFGGVLSDDDEAYYQFGDEPSPTVGGNFGPGGCMCSSGNTGGGATAFGYYGSAVPAAGGGGESPPSSQTHQCQPGSGGCGLFGGGGGSGAGDTDSGHYISSEIVKLTKGDLVLHTCHLIEMVTKIFLVVKNATGRGPELVISNEFPAIFNNQRVQLYFRYYSKKANHSASASTKGGATATARIPPSLPPPPGDGEFSSACPPLSAADEHHHPPNPPSSVPALSLPLPIPDGPISSVPKDISCSSSVPPAPPAPATSALIVSTGSGREEPVIPPSQIKITRKKSTRMEFLIGGGGHS